MFIFVDVSYSYMYVWVGWWFFLGIFLPKKPSPSPTRRNINGHKPSYYFFFCFVLSVVSMERFVCLRKTRKASSKICRPRIQEWRSKLLKCRGLSLCGNFWFWIMAIRDDQVAEVKNSPDAFFGSRWRIRKLRKSSRNLRALFLKINVRTRRALTRVLYI